VIAELDNKPFIAKSQQWLRKNVGDSVDVYRGVQGVIADEIKAELDKGKDSIDIPHAGISSYSRSDVIAGGFAEWKSMKRGGVSTVLIAMPVLIGRITHENNQFRGYQCLAVFLYALWDDRDSGHTWIGSRKR